jgi:hypothetical protein
MKVNYTTTANLLKTDVKEKQKLILAYIFLLILFFEALLT